MSLSVFFFTFFCKHQRFFPSVTRKSNGTENAQIFFFAFFLTASDT